MAHDEHMLGGVALTKRTFVDEDAHEYTIPQRFFLKKTCHNDRALFAISRKEMVIKKPSSS